MHKNVRYNCRVIFYNQQLLLIRPKLYLEMNGNYREMRWFAPWIKLKETEDHMLPSIISEIAGQVTKCGAVFVSVSVVTVVGICNVM